MELSNLIEAGRKIADIFAIPLFIIMIVYLIALNDQSTLGRFVLLFAFLGLACDLIFTTNIIVSKVKFFQ